MNRIHIFLVSIALTCFSAQAFEVITDFKSNIRVERDGTLDVTETIKVVAEGKYIRRGIFREFPTTYPHPFGFGFISRVGFDLYSVKRDGFKEPYRIEPRANGVAIMIGSSDRELSHDEHEYVIAYKTTRQLGFFSGYDELYFNVTGLGWMLPILHAEACVELPKKVSLDQMRIKGFSGPYGSADESGIVIKEISGKICAQTTSPLGVFEGFTILMSIPKGVVNAPTLWQKIQFFVSDNSALSLLIICLLFALLFVIFAGIKIRAQHPKGVIIPLFEPPSGFSPGACAYILNHTYSAKVFAADIVGLAVAGTITIERVTQMFSSFYKIALREDAPEEYFFESYRIIIKNLFARLSSIEVHKSYNQDVQRAMSSASSWYGRTYKSFFEYHESQIFVLGGFIAAVHILAFINDPILFSHSWFYVSLVLYLFVIASFVGFARSYSAKGRKYADQIEGFKMFLATTETERLALIGTPPDRTPQTYETYLPYAIALGVEKAWSKQFEPIFKDFERMHGHAYQPMWYVGTGFDMFAPAVFASSFSSTLNAASSVPSSQSAPGSKSGFSSGGGFSGGGGGGGGGGGW
ncbi:MAG: hypothetical protein UU47_C0009G0008 [candidate division TM6 bacterium GW2011_GWE2_41_16]|nr:MAG: hypothetical protein UU47_C0009G0008 [candidate division TM6 bacterium GW2011_GWE2_41_16]